MPDYRIVLNAAFLLLAVAGISVAGSPGEQVAATSPGAAALMYPTSPIPVDESGNIDLILSGSAGFSVSGASSGVAADIAYQPGLFGVGAGARAAFGLPGRELLVTARFTGRIGWFHANIGAVFEPVPPAERDGYTVFSLSDADQGYSPYVAVGLQPQLVEFDRGTLGFDLGLEAYVSAIYLEDTDDAAESLGQALASPFILIANIPKLHVGVTYRTVMSR